MSLIATCNGSRLECGERTGQWHKRELSAADAPHCIEVGERLSLFPWPSYRDCVFVWDGGRGMSDGRLGRSCCYCLHLDIPLSPFWDRREGL